EAGSGIAWLTSCSDDVAREQYVMGVDDCIQVSVRSSALKNSTLDLYWGWVGPEGNVVPPCFSESLTMRSLIDGWDFFFRDTGAGYRAPGWYRFEMWRGAVGSELAIRQNFELVP
ncbi:MAG TPA: hypothetical protein VK969_10105, partial [Acidimicrobiia bacterium]|nr:hypothetical protein [Acidimicrobiia bacterium]